LLTRDEVPNGFFSLEAPYPTICGGLKSKVGTCSENMHQAGGLNFWLPPAPHWAFPLSSSLSLVPLSSRYSADKVGTRLIVFVLLLLFCGSLVTAAFYSVEATVTRSEPAGEMPANPAAPTPPSPPLAPPARVDCGSFWSAWITNSNVGATNDTADCGELC
jgi:hypothetical protein